MNLIIDAGNTFVKTAVFQDDMLQDKKVFKKEEFSENFKKIREKFPKIVQAVISSVASNDSSILSEVKKFYPLLEIDQNIRLPFVNDYATPATLGKDRIALIAAATRSFPGKNVLVIDAGTCITYDLKTSGEVYKGGSISPGMEMRFNAVHKFTAKLPLVKPKPEVALIGDSTENSILSGIINGIRMELQGFIAAYEAEFEDLTVIFTGGDSLFLSIPSKNSIFANSNFLLEGLNFILEFNRTQ
ncbi:type III pantothenate kinase [Gramella sp. GC03-9]|uniref:Type III pantothenate kinase n=1 Tax=Christiangramia oceanisediminis TaxID=2920386 RepID=A0A9X2IB86_9FLAO|nr:type III pantothenate kinase [Gramella oceanisediminis]MCP9199653.1 type III pantothenate kinase [Gramella oceanisediminis]